MELRVLTYFFAIQEANDYAGLGGIAAPLAAYTFHSNSSIGGTGKADFNPWLQRKQKSDADRRRNDTS